MSKRLEQCKIRLVVIILVLTFQEPDYKKIFFLKVLKVFIYKVHALWHREQQLSLKP